MNVQCRKCNNKRQVIDATREHKYPDGILCFDCWSSTGTVHSIKVGSSKHKQSNSSSSSSSSTPYATDPESGWEISCKYEVGDSVFINTDKYGVLLCQIIDSEAWAMEHIYYTLDANGDSIDYVEEEELFDTALEAENSSEILKVS